MITEKVVAMIPATGWFAKFGAKRRPLAMWITEYVATNGRDEWQTHGVVASNKALVNPEQHSKFSGYEYRDFDKSRRITPSKAMDWLRDKFPEFQDGNVLRRAIDTRQSQVLLAALAEQKLEADWSDEDV